MKHLPLLCGLALLACLPAARSAEQLVDTTIRPGTNAVQTLWNATPGRTYRLQATTNLTAPWLNALPGPGTLTATSNALSQTIATDAFARFFRVVAVDTEGPEVFRTEPAAGGIAVSRSVTLRAWLRDDTGIATNTLALTLSNPTATNGPLTLTDARLSFTNGLLTYTPTNTETIGAAGDTVIARLSATDTLGNQTTNFTWSFQLELPPVASTNLVFIGGGTTPAARAAQALVPQAGPALTFVSSNANTLTYTYTGASSGVTNGMILVNSSLQSGYTVVVTNFTEYAVSNTVVVSFRPAKLAELLKDGSLVSQGFTEITTNATAPAAVLNAGLPLSYHHDLAQTVYSGGGLTVELLPGSAFDWNGKLDLGVNIRDFRLREFETLLSGTVTANLQARVTLSSTVTLSGSRAVITPIMRRYGTAIITPIGPVPVWVDVVYELEAGYSASSTAADSLTTGIVGTKEILVGRRWSDAEGWSTPFASPAPSYSFTTPAFSAEVTANAKVWLQPKVTVFLYSAAGVVGDLQPYLELAGNAQVNAGEASFDLSLYGGLTSTVGLNLKVWDEAWGEQPSHTFDLIPQTLLWHTNGSTLAPSITLQPQSVSVPSNRPVTFYVEAKGAAPLEYRWLRNGFYLTDDILRSGSRTATLRIHHAKGYDAGSYTVEVKNAKGTKVSVPAALVIQAPAPTGMALIPAGAFAMGDSAGGGYFDNLPVHTVFVSAFYIDKTAVTKALWDEVYAWAIANGYGFEYGAQGKAANHPVHTVTWYDAVKWCNARSQKEGRTPAYYTDIGQTQVYRSGMVHVPGLPSPGLPPNSSGVKWNAGYRLPTEAEWEKAARGGLSGQRFPWGNTISQGQANYYARPASAGGYSYDLSPKGYHPAYQGGGYPYTSPVGSFAANGYGLYDMAGNVWQWCWDWYGSSYYSASPSSDPVGPTLGLLRVIRGGGWSFDASLCRTASREYDDPDHRGYDVGFRSVLPPGQ